ncbi:hypothetical protein [uncultured Sphingomonas sp.]|uniref:hypothetical protein n=1 Tax=uncultured Sphingomonas sp. TaxID=158754 RepID=UPI0035CB8239
MMYTEQGYITLGIGRIRNCTHCGNNHREVVKRKYLKQDVFYIPTLRLRGEILFLCNICNWGYKSSAKDVISMLPATFWDGRANTKVWFERNNAQQKRAIVAELKKLDLHAMIDYLKSA